MEESLEDDIKKIYKERMVSEIDKKLRELRYIPPNTRYNYDLEGVFVFPLPKGANVSLFRMKKKLVTFLIKSLGKLFFLG